MVITNTIPGLHGIPISFVSPFIIWPGVKVFSGGIFVGACQQLWRFIQARLSVSKQARE